MATFKKLTTGNWQAQIAKNGKRAAKSFPTKKAAQDWATREEYISSNAEPVLSTLLVKDVFKRYGEEVSVLRKGNKTEQVRLKRFSLDKIGDIVISKISPEHIADWRNRRLKTVANATVAREMNLLSSVMNVARLEWRYLKTNPVTDVRSPKKPPGRTQMVTERQLEVLTISAGLDLTNTTARAFHAFKFAMETAMRAGEIVGMFWKDIDLEKRVIHLPKTKNGHPRNVPMTLEAVKLVQMLPHADPPFNISSASLDALWRKLRKRAGVEDLHFHDSRRNATTKLFKLMDVLDLAKATGHRDLAMLLNVYYSSDTAEVAKEMERKANVAKQLD